MTNVPGLLVSAGFVHPPWRGRRALRDLLSSEPGFAFDEVSSLTEAAQRDLTQYAVLVLYYHHRDTPLADADLAAFRDFVEAGGGVLAVHSATASYKPTAAYFDVLGGRFIGHGPVHAIDVRPTADADSIFAGIGPFTVTDELYLHERHGDFRVHFDTEHEGRREPMVWTREVGRGRVCYSCPGHRSASMYHPAVQEILRRGLRWVCRAP